MSSTSQSELPILPGATLGVIGGGQLGRMFCQVAQRMGYRVAVYDSDPQSPAGLLAEYHFCAAYDDEERLRSFGQQCAAVTTEFENVPAAALALLSQYTRVAPDAEAVAITQDRVREKTFLHQAGVEVAPFHAVQQAQDLQQASAALFPGLLKTARFGYDGKGQVPVANVKEAVEAFQQLQAVPCILEAQLDLAAELSVVLARGHDGQYRCYDPAFNEHQQGILAISRVQGDSNELLTRAQEQAVQIAQAMSYEGVLCVEFFVLADGRLIANEIAPRPHNSGHHTIEACLSSQFEQQVRVLAGLPLGSTALRQPAVMLNILGDCWFPQGQQEAQTPPWADVLALDGVFLHLYGKTEARRGRKMGHLTAVGHTLEQAEQRARAAAQVLAIHL